MTKTQAGVVMGMAAAVIGALVLFSLPADWASAHATPDGRALVAALAALGPLVCLTAAIAVIANIRFFSQADIDGAGLTVESPRIRIPRAILANTLEQAALAIPLYAALAFLLPPDQLARPLMLSAAFVAARAVFAAGYAAGAAARSFGFAFTFYPTVGALILLAARIAAAW